MKLAKLLSIVTGNLRNLLLVLVNLPFALVGGVLAALLTGGNLSLGSLVGFVTIFGITLRNSIMLISHCEHFGARGRHDLEPGNCDLRRFGAIGADLDDGVGHRLGLLPLAIGSGDPSREIEGPTATVVLGGLVTSTALNLLVPQRLGVELQVAALRLLSNVGGAAIFANVFANLEAERFASAHRTATSQECAEHAVLSFRFFSGCFPSLSWRCSVVSGA